MLIQANSQTERSAEDLDADINNAKLTPTPTSGSSHQTGNEDDVEMQSVDDKTTPLDGITIKEEVMTDDCPPTASSTPIKSSDEFKHPNHEQLPPPPPLDNTDTTLKMEVDDDDTDQTTLKPSAIAQPSADANSKDINIDPRTYCKLGHFHLLLEEYPKGNLFLFFFFIKMHLN